MNIVNYLQPLSFLVFFLIILNFFFIRLWNLLSIDLHNSYNAKQKIHNGSVCRLGGLALIIVIFFGSFFDYLPFSLIIKSIIFCSIPLIVVTSYEDIFKNTHPRLRLFSILISSSFLVFLIDFSYPVIEWPFFFNIISTYPLLYSLLLIFSLSVLANGFNLIDGANGLFCFTTITILLCLNLLSNQLSDFYFSSLWQSLIIFYITQLLFNFPLGKIFLGDLGAYVTGIIIGFFIIIFFGNNNLLLTWQIILVLFYPSFELLFSVIRRKISNEKLTEADRLHLHQLVFDYLCLKISNNKICNNLTSIILSPVWSFPLLWMLVCSSPLLNIAEIFFGLTLNMIIYLTFYLFFYSKNHA